MNLVWAMLVIAAVTAVAAAASDRALKHFETALEFETVVEISHARGVPVVVDAASTIPPLDHLRRWISSQRVATTFSLRTSTDRRVRNSGA